MQVESLGALKDCYAELKRRAVRILKAVDHGTTNSIYFCDPAGNRLELYCDVGTDSLACARRRTARSQSDFPPLSLDC